MQFDRVRNNKVLIKLDEQQEKTPSGIIIPDTAKEKKTKGVVTAIGSKVEDLKVNEHVIFSQYAGENFTLDDGEYIVIGEQDVNIVVKGE